MATHLEAHLAAVEQNASLGPGDRARAVTSLQDIVQDERQSPERFAERFGVWAETYQTGVNADATRADMVQRLTARSVTDAPDAAGTVGVGESRVSGGRDQARGWANGSRSSPGARRSNGSGPPNGSTALRHASMEPMDDHEPPSGV